MLEIQTIDHIDNLVYYTNYCDMEEYTARKEIIFNQLRDFNDLGVNLLKDIEEGDIKNMIYSDIIEYARNNFLNLYDKDYILTDAQLKQTATIIYELLCVDCFNIIIPRILEELEIQTVKQLDRILMFNRNNKNFIKKKMTEHLEGILKYLVKLKNLATAISENENYKDMMRRFGNYLELIDFSDNETFVDNYLRPVVNKHFTQLLWRTLSAIN